MGGSRLSREDRRKQIKEVALKLFTDKGYAKTTMDEIVQECGISKGGMYHHFANKEEIFVELLKDGGEYRQNIVLEYMKGSFKSRDEKLIDSLLDKVLDVNPYKKLYIVFLIEMQSNPAFKELFEKIYDKSLENFIKFCKEEGLNEYISISNKEFTFLLNSLYVGMYLFENIEKEKLKEKLRIMFGAYLKRQ